MSLKPILCLLLAASQLGGCLATGGDTITREYAPGQILYGSDTIVECTYAQGCRTVAQ